MNTNDSPINMEGWLDGDFLLESNHFYALQYDRFRACIDSLVTREKFGIRERKVNFFERLDL